jgi:hypothetical protein
MYRYELLLPSWETCEVRELSHSIGQQHGLPTQSPEQKGGPPQNELHLDLWPSLLGRTRDFAASSLEKERPENACYLSRCYLNCGFRESGQWGKRALGFFCFTAGALYAGIIVR